MVSQGDPSWRGKSYSTYSSRDVQRGGGVRETRTVLRHGDHWSRVLVGAYRRVHILVNNQEESITLLRVHHTLNYDMFCNREHVSSLPL